MNFKLQGMVTVTRTIALTTAQSQTLDAAMKLSGVTEKPRSRQDGDGLDGFQGSTTVTTELTNKLPVARTIVSAVDQSAGVAQITGLGNAFTISGAPTFDNLFTVDGAVIIDNLRATPNNLFIEDAIQETTTTVSSVSAEFGRSPAASSTRSRSREETSFRLLPHDADQRRLVGGHAGGRRVQHVDPRYEGDPGRVSLEGPRLVLRVRPLAGHQHRQPDGGSRGRVAASVPARPEREAVPGQADADSLPGTHGDGQLPEGGHGADQQLLRDDPRPRQPDDRSLPQEIVTASYNGIVTENFFVEGCTPSASSRSWARDPTSRT